nr:RecX family transcriptional regulator [Bacilli bacterium]
MKIDKYKKMANNKYKIYFEDGESITTYDSVIINNGLLYKKEIDLDLYEQILEENKYYDLYNKCIKLISSRMRSVKEINDYLSKNEASNKDIESIITKLSDMGLLNDKMYVKAYVSDKINFTNFGPLKIKNELENMGIDSGLIEQELSRMNDKLLNDRVAKYIARKAKTNKKSMYLFKEKMISDLINQGYSKDMILDNLEDIKIESNIDSEYKKIYNKLSSKYEGYELKQKIKNKLYQRGYSRGEIEKVIEKVDY